MSDIEGIKLVELIIQKLLYESELDITSFRTDSSREYNSFHEVDGASNRSEPLILPEKHIEVEWNPKRYSENAKMRSDAGGISINYRTVTTTVSIRITDNHKNCGSIETKLGCGSSNKEIKKAFIGLHRKISHHQNIVVPRVKREKFINNLVKMFPDLLDALILEDHDDKERND